MRADGPQSKRKQGKTPEKKRRQRGVSGLLCLHSKARFRSFCLRYFTFILCYFEGLWAVDVMYRVECIKGHLYAMAFVYVGCLSCRDGTCLFKVPSIYS